MNVYYILNNEQTKHKDIKPYLKATLFSEIHCNQTKFCNANKMKMYDMYVS